MRDRLESILMHITQREARQLLTQLPHTADRTTYLADGLAREGILVMRGAVPQRWQAQAQPLVQTWMDLHQEIYDTWASILFPAFAGSGWMTLEMNQQPTMLLDGQCQILIDRHAQYLIPYLALRHGQRPINEMELRGVVSFALQELDASNLAGTAYNWLMSQTIDVMRELLRQPVQQLPLTGRTNSWLTRNGVQAYPEQSIQPSGPYAPQPLQPPSMTPMLPPVQTPSMMPPPPPEFDENPTEPILPIREDTAQVGQAARPSGIIGGEANLPSMPENPNRRWRFPVPRLPRDQRGS